MSRNDKPLKFQASIHLCALEYETWMVIYIFYVFHLNERKLPFPAFTLQNNYPFIMGPIVCFSMEALQFHGIKSNPFE